MRESLIEREVSKHAKRRGFHVRKCRWIGRDGAPDRLFFGKGRSFFIEFKATGEKPEPLQAREHKRMRDAGLRVEVVDDIESGCALFD